MGPLVEALLVFVGIPAIALAALAAAVYGVVVVIGRLTAPAVPVSTPASANIVVFPGVRPTAVASDGEDARRAA